MYYPGAILLWAAALLGVTSTVAFAVAVGGDERWRRLARQTYVLMTLAVVVASGLLMYLLLTHDYRVFYVYSYSDNALPIHYLISTFWAGQEGSFLVWIFFGALLGLPLMHFARTYESRVMLFYNLTVLSLLVLLLKQNPFRFHQGLTTALIPADGQGLNPLLQNPWMVIHPPVMFVGYASLAIPFAFALAALWMRRYDEWTKVTLPWVLLSVGTLGTAIMMGGYWAYETLGWGGYWGWDPVENASLVPWLATAALTHGMLLQRSRGRFRRLNIVLAVAAYLLVVYATFLTRSGVLSDFSVHSFVDLGITGWLVANILFFLVLATGMMAWRWRDVPTEVGTEPFLSLTIFTVLGVLMLILIGFGVLVGTSWPLISQLMGEPAQVGPDFYNRMGYWLAVAFAMVLGASPFLGWSRAGERAGRKLAVVMGLTGVAMVMGIFWVGPVLGWRDGLANVEVSFAGVLAAIYCAAAVFAVVANSWGVFDRFRSGRWRSAGGAVAHVGMALMVLAFMTTGWFGSGQKAELELARPTEVLGYTMSFKGREKPTPAARDAMVVEVADGAGGSFEMRPLMWVNPKSNQLMANPDIKSSLTSDLYFAPSSYTPGEGAQVSATFTLVKGQSQSFRDWTVLFKRFELGEQHSETITVGVVVELQQDGHEPVELVPRLGMTADGRTEAVEVSIPGTDGGAIRTTGMNVDSGAVRIELLGLGGGIGRTATMHKGETLTYNDLKITFADFDLSSFEPEAGNINFGVVFEVERGGDTIEVVPVFRAVEGGTQVLPAEIAGTGGMMLSVGRVDAEGGAVQVQVFDPNLEAAASDPATLVLDVSTKPLIGLIWLGTILVMVGVVMAIVVRSRDVASIAAPGDSVAAVAD